MANNLFDQLTFEDFVDFHNVINGYQQPALHARITQWLEKTHDKKRRVLQVFRNAGKSYLVSLYVVWRLLRDPKLTIMIISAKTDLAENITSNIKHVIESNPLCDHMKGNGKWTETKFFIAGVTDYLHPSVTCTSVESDYVGKHAKLIIIDDLETDENSASKKKREFLRDTIAEMNAIGEEHLYVGTPHAKDSIYTFLKNAGYELLHIPIYTGEQLAWPNHPENKFNWEWIELTRNTSPKWYFNSQYLLIPDAPDASTIHSERIARYDFELDFSKRPTLDGKLIVDMGAYWDPASGHRDKSTFAILFKTEDNDVYLHRLIILPRITDKEGFKPQCRAIAKTCEDTRIGKVTVEQSVSPVLHTELTQTAAEMKIRLRVRKEPRSMNKEKYISIHLEPLVHSGRLHAHHSVPSTFFQELEDFGSSKHDDCIDAVSGAVAQLRGDRIVWNTNFDYTGAQFGDATIIEMPKYDPCERFGV